MQFNQTTLDRLWRDPNRLSMPTLHTAGLTGGRRRRRGDAIQDTTRGWPSWKRAFAVGHHSSIPNGGRPPFESEIGPASSLRHPPMQTSNSTSCCRRMEICCGKMGGRSAMEPWELSSKKMQKKKEERNKQRPPFPSWPPPKSLCTSKGSRISPPSPHRIVSSRFQPDSIIPYRDQKSQTSFFQPPNQATPKTLSPFLGRPSTRPRVTAQASAKPPAR